jgi:transposase
MSKRRRFVVDIVREVLRLKLQLLKSNREIGRTLKISKSTVASYFSRIQIAKISSYDEIQELSDQQLREIIFPEKPGQNIIAIDFKYFHKELARPYVTLQLLWQEESEKNKSFYSYSHFSRRYKEWRKTLDISMRQVHKAGEKLFIDYAGTTVPITNRKTGEVKPAQLYLATLGASSYTYAEVTWTQSTIDFISSSVNTFEFFGGVSEQLIPDNLKSAVQIASRYEPTINRTYRELAKHYGSVVIPARVRKPKDKALVEGAVLIASRWILAALRNRTFFSLNEANEAIWELLEKMNSKKFQKMDGSRESIFNEIEKKELKPLPNTRFIISEWKKTKANIDYHVDIEKTYYSVPFQLRGKVFDARYTSQTVELFLDGKRITSHKRLHKKGTHSTHSEHMPKSHTLNLDWPPSRIISWARSIGACTALMVTRIMEQREHPEQGYKACLGIISLEKKYSKERLENACKRSLKFGGISYKSVSLILKKELDLQEILPLEDSSEIKHENI